MDSTPSPDKEASMLETELEAKLTMSDKKDAPDPDSDVGDKPRTLNEIQTPADLEQLVQSRRAALEQKQIARKAAWREEKRHELDQRNQYIFQMEGRGIPRANITSWEEQLALYQISPEWRKRFKRAKSKFEFLLPAVFLVLSEQQIKTDTGTKWLFPVKLIRDFRRVSKTFKDAIDNSLSATRYHELTSGVLDPPSNPNRTHNKQRVIRPSFFSLESLTDFKRWERRYSGNNPFPSRHLYIGAPKGNKPSPSLGMAYWIEMGELLNRWGKEIWSVLYVFEDGSIEMMYEFLIRYLKSMPNLKELVIMDRDRSGAHEGQDVIPLLKSRIERNPLPELPQLHTIFLVDLTPVPLIAAALEKYGDTLKRFMFHVPDAFSGDFADLEQLVSGNPLPLRKYSCRFTDSSKIPHWNLQFPQLTELELTYLNAIEGPEVDNVFKTVNSCGSSLRQLRLAVLFDLPDPLVEDQWWDLFPPGTRLELPHLERLELTVEKPKVTNVDLLLPLVSLKELTFSYLTSELDEPEMDGDGIIQFVGYQDRMYDSNIWGLLPEINLLTIRYIPIENPSEEHILTSAYTRDGYWKFQRDQDKI